MMCEELSDHGKFTPITVSGQSMIQPGKERQVAIVASFDLPVVYKQNMIWQPVSDNDGKKMRLAPLEWQPSGSHHAIQHLINENTQLRAEIAELQARIAGLEARGAVKPLVWDKGVVDWARPLPGMKYVACSSDGLTWAWWLEGDGRTHAAPRQVLESESAAKAAAQADYEKRILSALEVSDEA